MSLCLASAMGSLLSFSGTARELAARPPVSSPMEGTAPGFARLAAEHLSVGFSDGHSSYCL